MNGLGVMKDKTDVNRASKVQMETQTKVKGKRER